MAFGRARASYWSIHGACDRENVTARNDPASNLVTFCERSTAIIGP